MPKTMTTIGPTLVTLTQGFLDRAKEGWFAKGTFIDSPEGLNMANTGNEVRWIAKRGYHNDRAIYYQNPYYINAEDPLSVILRVSGEWDRDRIMKIGDKIPKSLANKLVPCSPEALESYRS